MSEVTRDRFGSASGTKCAKINAALSRTPITAAAIAKKHKLNVGFVQNHLRTLRGKKFILKTEEGYKVRKPKKAAK